LFGNLKEQLHVSFTLIEVDVAISMHIIFNWVEIL